MSSHYWHICAHVNILQVWRKYEMKQKPAFILDVVTPSGTFDVNISPDKREIVLTNEDLIIDKLKSAIDAQYESSRYTFHVNRTQTPLDTSSQQQLSLDTLSSASASASASATECVMESLFPEDSSQPMRLYTPADLDSELNYQDPVAKDDTPLLETRKRQPGCALETPTERGLIDVGEVAESAGAAVSRVGPDPAGGRATVSSRADPAAAAAVVATTAAAVVATTAAAVVATTAAAVVATTATIASSASATAASETVWEHAREGAAGNRKKRKRSLEQVESTVWSFDPDEVLRNVKCKRCLIDRRVEFSVRIDMDPQPLPREECLDTDTRLEAGAGWHGSAVSAIEGKEGIRVLCKEVTAIYYFSYFNLSSTSAQQPHSKPYL
jgi:DNA mismatch repair ATPase MutL